MIFIAGVSPKIKPSGSASCTCPACGSQAALYMNKKYSVVTFFFIPVIPFGASYIATCSNCASILALDKKAGRTLEYKPDTQITPEHLNVVQNNCGPSCHSCGARVQDGQNFCPNCGDRI